MESQSGIQLAVRRDALTENQDFNLRQFLRLCHEYQALAGTIADRLEELARLRQNAAEIRAEILWLDAAIKAGQ